MTTTGTTNAAALTETSSSSKQRRVPYLVAVAVLLTVLVVELLVPAWRQSASFDEGCHTLAGYNYWTRGDFGINPEHPPLVKLLATSPLLTQPLRDPPPGPPLFFKVACFTEGRGFLFSNTLSPDSILLRARTAAASLALLAALLTFAFAYELFGRATALAALALFVLEPNLIAHGSLVTTDMGMTAFFVASVYAFYRYVKRPSVSRLAVAGVAVGLALAAKHSAVIVLPILCALALVEFFAHDRGTKLSAGGRLKHGLRLAASLLCIGVISVAVLWSFYGFRFAARPHGQPLNPPFREYVQRVPAISTLARYRVLPEAYLYGAADLLGPNRSFSYLFGTFYGGGRWFYFPAVLVIKTTIGMLLLLLLVPVALAFGAHVNRRDLLFLLVPAAVYLAVAMNSGLNRGVRYILPVYPFLILMAALAVWRLARARKPWRYAAWGLLTLHALTSAHAFPNYVPYSNEIWGGPSQTYKVLTDSNVDWGQQLKQTKAYLDARGVKDCWFGYFASLTADPNYYGIPCKPMLAPSTSDVIPAHLSGTVLISATAMASGGPGELNPYAPFLHLRPDDVIDGGVLVYRGEFEVPLLSARSHARVASALLQNTSLDEAQASQALTEAQAAVAVAPKDVISQVVLGDVLAKLNRQDESRAAYQQALALAETMPPALRDNFLLADIKRKLR